MGTIKQGVLGGFSGKVGNVVGGSWKGIDYMRIMPASVANPQTEPQMDQRTKFATVLQFLQPLTQFLRTGFKNYAIRMTAFNNAMSYNIKNGVSGAYPSYTIDYPNALVARGSLTAALNPEATSTVPATVAFAWDDNTIVGNASALDKTLVVVYNPVKKEAVYQSELAERADLTQSVTVPAAFSGDQVQCYLAFMTPDGSLLSNSKFAGAVTVA